MDYSFGKIPTFLVFFNSLFSYFKKAFFFLRYFETHFHGLFCHKNKDGKFLIFWRKPWTNNFEKNLNFSFFFICSKAFLGCIFFVSRCYSNTGIPTFWHPYCKTENPSDNTGGPSSIWEYVRFRIFNMAIMIKDLYGNRTFPSSPGPLFQNEGRCSAFDMEIIFHSHASKTHFHKKGCAPIVESFWKWGFLEIGSSLFR